MPVFKIHHITKYEYDRPVKENVNEIKVFPFQCEDQETLQHDLKITGNPDVQTFIDYWGNKTGTFNLLAAHKELIVESKLLIRTTSPGQIRVNFHSGWQQLQDEMNGNLSLLEFADTKNIELQEEIDRIIKTFYSPAKSVASVVEYFCEYIFKNFEYIKGITNIETTVDEILQHKAGVCQDFAHLLLQILRTINIPSRYISGYICPNKNGMRGEGATHAWVEVWIPQYGWAGIDPTNNVWVTNTHVKLAVGRNFNDCSPVKGTFKGPARQKLAVYVTIGYESGHVFEEMNNVKLLEQPSLPGDDHLLDNSFAQQ